MHKRAYVADVRQPACLAERKLESGSCQGWLSWRDVRRMLLGEVGTRYAVAHACFVASVCIYGSA